MLDPDKLAEIEKALKEKEELEEEEIRKAIESGKAFVKKGLEVEPLVSPPAT